MAVLHCGDGSRHSSGLALSADGFTLALGRRTATPGRRFRLRFQILDERDRKVDGGVQTAAFTQEASW
jgi:hypothetical protein